jgi:hypothetical protein
MHEDRADEALRDDLGVELEQLMAIEPAPELRVRVRERIARGGGTAWWPVGLQIAGGGVFALVIVALFVIPRVENVTPSTTTVPPSVTAAVAGSRPAVEQPVPARPRPVVARVARAKPPVRRTPPPALDYPLLLMPPIEPLHQLSIEPVVVEPLAPIPLLSGERQ